MRNAHVSLLVLTSPRIGLSRISPGALSLASEKGTTFITRALKLGWVKTWQEVQPPGRFVLSGALQRREGSSWHQKARGFWPKLMGLVTGVLGVGSSPGPTDPREEVGGGLVVLGVGPFP